MKRTRTLASVTHNDTHSHTQRHTHSRASIAATEGILRYPSHEMQNGRLVMKVRELEIASKELGDLQGLDSLSQDLDNAEQQRAMRSVSLDSTLDRFMELLVATENPELQQYESARMHPLYLRFSDNHIERLYRDDLKGRMLRSLSISLKLMCLASIVFFSFNVLMQNYMNSALIVLIGTSLFIGMVSISRSNKEKSKKAFTKAWILGFVVGFLAVATIYYLDQNRTVPEYIVLTLFVFHALVRYRIQLSFVISCALVLLKLLSLVTYTSGQVWGRIAFVILTSQTSFLAAEYQYEKLDRLSFINSKKVQLCRDDYRQQKNKSREILQLLYPRPVATHLEKSPDDDFQIFEESDVVFFSVSLPTPEVSLHTSRFNLKRNTESGPLLSILKRHPVHIVYQTESTFVCVCGLFKKEESAQRVVIDTLKDLIAKGYFQTSSRHLNSTSNQIQVYISSSSAYAGFSIGKTFGLDVIGPGLDAVMEAALEVNKNGIYFDASVASSFLKTENQNVQWESEHLTSSKKWLKVKAQQLSIGASIDDNHHENSLQPGAIASSTLMENQKDGKVASLEENTQDEEIEEHLDFNVIMDEKDNQTIHKHSVRYSHEKRSFSIKLHYSLFLLNIAVFGALESAGLAGEFSTREDYLYWMYYICRYGISGVMTLGIYFAILQDAHISPTDLHQGISNGLPNFAIWIHEVTAVFIPILLFPRLHRMSDSLVSFILFEGFATVITHAACPTVQKRHMEYVLLPWIFSWATLYYIYGPTLLVEGILLRALIVFTKCVLPIIMIYAGSKRKEEYIRHATRTRSLRRLEAIRLDQQREQIDQIILAVLPQREYTSLKIGETLKFQHSESAISIAIRVFSSKLSYEDGDPMQYVETTQGLRAAITSLGMTHGVDLIKSIGQLFVFASGYRQYNPATLRSALKFSVEVAQLLDRWHLSWSSDATSRFRIAVDKGPVQYGFTRAPLVSFDVWGDAAQGTLHMVGSMPDRHIQIGAGVYCEAEGVWKERIFMQEGGEETGKQDHGMYLRWMGDPWVDCVCEEIDITL